LLEERVRLGESRAIAHRAEQLGRLPERLLGGGVFDGEQAAALAEQGICALGDVSELLPACGGFGVEGCRLGVVAGVLGELGAGGAEGVLVERRTMRPLGRRMLAWMVLLRLVLGLRERRSTQRRGVTPEKGLASRPTASAKPLLA